MGKSLRQISFSIFKILKNNKYKAVRILFLECPILGFGRKEWQNYFPNFNVL